MEKEFSHYKAGAGTLTRKKLDKITKRLMKEQNYVSAIGEKLVIIRGRAGTGKTFKLVRIAYELALHKNKRCLILTYNSIIVS